MLGSIYLGLKARIAYNRNINMPVNSVME